MKKIKMASPFYFSIYTPFANVRVWQNEKKICRLDKMFKPELNVEATFKSYKKGKERRLN